MHGPVHRIDQEQAPEEQHLGEQEEPHPQLGAGVVAVFGGCCFCEFGHRIKPPPLQGEGWGGDGSSMAAQTLQTHPPPNLPLKGEESKADASMLLLCTLNFEL